MPTRLSRAGVALAAAFAAYAPSALAQQPTAAADSTPRSRPTVVRHTVKRGDTLWDIARFYLKDPFRWPQVFHANTDIVKNPHWIYPGQVLTIDGAAVKDEVAAATNEQGFIVSRIQTRAQAPTVFSEASSTGVAPQLARVPRQPVLTVRPGEYEAAPYVVSADRPLGDGHVVGAVETLALGLHSDAGYRLNDRLYVSGPVGTSLQRGDFILAARADDVIPQIGRVVEPRAVLRVDSVAAAGLVMATLVRQYGTVANGQSIVPLGQPFAETVERPVKGSYPLSAKLLWIQGTHELPSLQTYVVLGARDSQGVRPGDEFTLFDDPASHGAPRTPPIATGTVKIVRVTPYGASGIIVDQVQPQIREGMAAHLTARMP